MLAVQPTGLSYFTSPTNIPPASIPPPFTRRPIARSYKSHFRQRYILEKNWRHGGTLMARYVTNDHGVVTTLCMSDKYIIVGLDNASIRVFDEDGKFQMTLAGHETGVWAMVIVGEDQLVSGGCDRDMRLWNLTTGYQNGLCSRANLCRKCDQVLRGHTSTVRCIQSAGYKTVVSGSRDTTLRVWDLQKGVSTKVLVGHSSSVRCLAVHGDIVVSGSYDYTAMVPTPPFALLMW
jgi:F-box and WD-40 domain protein CDC4